MNNVWDFIKEAEESTSTITEAVITSDTTVGTEIKGIWNTMMDFMNSHSKAFAIALSVLAALVVLSLFVALCKKFFCKKKYYYRRKR